MRRASLTHLQRQSHGLIGFHFFDAYDFLIAENSEYDSFARGCDYIPHHRTGDVTHPPLVYILDAEGRIAYATTGGVEAMVELLGRV